MRTPTPDHGLKIFTTCPTTLLAQPETCFRELEKMARCSEDAGCEGMLVFTDNAQLDPWLVSQIIIEATDRLCPLIAIQPIYMHPYSVAKMITSLAFLHGRRVYLNMVAGGFKNDLTALNDSTPHDSRYQRLVEYTLIIKRLLESRTPVTFEGQFYRVNSLSLNPRLSTELLPGILVSGSSDSGMAAAKEMGAVAVKYPEPPDQCKIEQGDAGPCGVRIGIIARVQAEEAWNVAYRRFPDDRKGQITRQLATKVSDSAWHKRLSEISDPSNPNRDTYWLHPFENYQTNCSYLVGSYQPVDSELARYMFAGYRTYILDIPPAEEEFEHIGAVFELASRRTAV